VSAPRYLTPHIPVRAAAAFARFSAKVSNFEQTRAAQEVLFVGHGFKDRNSSIVWGCWKSKEVKTEIPVSRFCNSDRSLHRREPGHTSPRSFPINRSTEETYQ
jgi:hypothetical protein